MPEITVVMPLYNKGKFVKRTLDSIFRQNFDDIEVIVVDDGSNDDGPQVVADHNDSRIRLIRQENSGPGAARNRGISEASSPYICFLDADDEYIDGFFNTTYTFLDDNPDCAGVSVDSITEDGKLFDEVIVNRLNLYNGIYKITPDFDPNRLSDILIVRGHCTWLYKTDVIKKSGGYYENRNTYGEDQYFILKLAMLNEFGIIRKPLHMYHTQDSDLNYNRNTYKPPMPFLVDPKPIYEICPKEMHNLLDKFLELRASFYVKGTMKSQKPDKVMARDLLKKYSYVGANLSERLKAWAWYYAAPLIKMLKN